MTEDMFRNDLSLVCPPQIDREELASRRSLHGGAIVICEGKLDRTLYEAHIFPWIDTAREWIKLRPDCEPGVCSLATLHAATLVPRNANLVIQRDITTARQMLRDTRKRLEPFVRETQLGRECLDGLHIVSDILTG